MARRLNASLDKKRLRQLVLKGWSDNAIADRLQCDRTTVLYHRRKLGLSANFDTHGRPVGKRGRVTRANVGD